MRELNKKDLTKIITNTINVMNLTETDLAKGREFAVGFLIGDIYKQQELIEYLKKPCKIIKGKNELNISLITKFKKRFVKIQSDVDG